MIGTEKLFCVILITLFMDENIVKTLVNKLMKSAQLILTFAYLLAIGIGMLFNNQKYNAFGINIFDYSSIFDFLIAPFADFRIVAFAIVTMVITYLLFKGDAYWKEKFPANYSKSIFNLEQYSWYRKIKGGVFIFIFIWYLILMAQYYGKRTYVETLQQETTKIEYIGGDVIEGILIGKTSDMLFLYVNQEVKAIPISANLKTIQIK
ncbi:hypothetical protein [Myroides odoratimimus]|uniref:Uncharacterized protein n=1 Tax=Myroides odoratimimus TaxID=76832 RepID=A0AAI8G5P6_9FLAO|nr:hypothetical protein AS202_12725 [Myroides odoratimimus]SHM34448.1 hypothetical protein SAMN05444275_11213 [Myroides odoratimimus subsp. xuanwuensis]MCA4806414.1 hypothetical protein [Myroides odoratimimus]MDM1034646.1 hypothetical protein [Myroides odoratimimus]MDM1038364.1 hypothetical protein [Myroides odoratimimus]